MELRNKRISDDDFQRQREEVLTQWPTGADVNFEEGVAYQAALPEHKKFGKSSEAKAEGAPSPSPEPVWP